MIGGRLFSRHLMNDRGKVGAHGTSGTGPEETVTHTYGSESACRFIADSVREVGGHNQTDLSEARVMLPLGTTVDELDRFQITKLQRGNYRETLSTPLTFAIMGSPKQDESHIILKLKAVTGGSKL